MANHLTPEELSKEMGIKRDDVVRLCHEQAVPIYHGKIDKFLFSSRRPGDAPSRARQGPADGSSPRRPAASRNLTSMLRAVAATVVCSLAVVVPNAGAATLNQTINGWIAHSDFSGAHTTLLVFDRNTEPVRGRPPCQRRLEAGLEHEARDLRDGALSLRDGDAALAPR